MLEVRLNPSGPSLKGGIFRPLPFMVCGESASPVSQRDPILYDHVNTDDLGVRLGKGKGVLLESGVVEAWSLDGTPFDPIFVDRLHQVGEAI